MSAWRHRPHSRSRHAGRPYRCRDRRSWCQEPTLRDMCRTRRTLGLGSGAACRPPGCMGSRDRRLCKLPRWYSPRSRAWFHTGQLSGTIVWGDGSGLQRGMVRVTRQASTHIINAALAVAGRAGRRVRARVAGRNAVTTLVVGRTLRRARVGEVFTNTAAPVTGAVSTTRGQRRRAHATGEITATSCRIRLGIVGSGAAIGLTGCLLAARECRGIAHAAGKVARALGHVGQAVPGSLAAVVVAPGWVSTCLGCSRAHAAGKLARAPCNVGVAVKGPVAAAIFAGLGRATGAVVGLAETAFKEIGTARKSRGKVEFPVAMVAAAILGLSACSASSLRRSTLAALEEIGAEGLASAQIKGSIAVVQVAALRRPTCCRGGHALTARPPVATGRLSSGEIEHAVTVSRLYSTMCQLGSSPSH